MLTIPDILEQWPGPMKGADVKLLLAEYCYWQNWEKALRCGLFLFAAFTVR